MPAQKNTDKLKQRFDKLSNADKVRSVLTVIREPIPREHVLRISGIEEKGLSEDDALEISHVFSNEAIKAKGSEGEDKYIFSENAKDRVEGKIDSDAAEHQIELFYEKAREAKN